MHALPQLGNPVARHPGKVPHSGWRTSHGRQGSCEGVWLEQQLHVEARDKPQPILWTLGAQEQGWCPGSRHNPWG
jgi:hypothetical protein